jgi:hypothetical protein
VLRAGPLSDERVIRLINRRFVPLYFDLSKHGVMADKAARKFVVQANGRLGGQGVPTPNLMIMTTKGKVVGEVSNYGTTRQVLKGLLRALDKNPDYDQPSELEKNHTDDIMAAQIKVDLLDYEGATKILKSLAKNKNAPAEVHDHVNYLLGRLCRMDRDWKAMAGYLKKVKSKDLADDVRMEQAYRFWCQEEFEQLRAHLAQFPKDSNRVTEASYHLGLAHYHLGAKKDARKVWSRCVKSCSQDPWIYRADWAYTQSKQKGNRGSFSSSGKRNSLLNRIGYMGRGNPDLSGPAKKLTLKRKGKAKGE